MKKECRCNYNLKSGIILSLLLVLIFSFYSNLGFVSSVEDLDSLNIKTKTQLENHLKDDFFSKSVKLSLIELAIERNIIEEQDILGYYQKAYITKEEKNDFLIKLGADLDIVDFGELNINSAEDLEEILISDVYGKRIKEYAIEQAVIDRLISEEDLNSYYKKGYITGEQKNSYLEDLNQWKFLKNIKDNFLGFFSNVGDSLENQKLLIYGVKDEEGDWMLIWNLDYIKIVLDYMFFYVLVVFWSLLFALFSILTLINPFKIFQIYKSNKRVEELGIFNQLVPGRIIRSKDQLRDRFKPRAIIRLFRIEIKFITKRGVRFFPFYLFSVLAPVWYFWIYQIPSASNWFFQIIAGILKFFAWIVLFVYRVILPIITFKILFVNIFLRSFIFAVIINFGNIFYKRYQDYKKRNYYYQKELKEQAILAAQKRRMGI